MATIARNRAIDIVRRQRPETDIEDAEIEILVSHDTVFDEVVLADEVRQLEYCLDANRLSDWHILKAGLGPSWQNGLPSRLERSRRGCIAA